MGEIEFQFSDLSAYFWLLHVEVKAKLILSTMIMLRLSEAKRFERLETQSISGTVENLNGS